MKGGKDGLRSSCLVCDREYARNRQPLYRKRNKELVANQQRVYREANKEEISDYLRKYRQENKVELTQKRRLWEKENKELRYAHVAKRRAAKLQAHPKWEEELTQFVHEEAYELSTLRKHYTGLTHHVDHVIPLSGKAVCGLHVWNNFAVIPALENLQKGNKLCHL